VSESKRVVHAAGGRRSTNLVMFTS